MKKLSREHKFDGIIVDAYESVFETDGKKLLIEQVEHPGGVCVAAMNDEGNMLLVKQYRFGVEKDLLEFPAGLIEPNEEPSKTALRELQEETGYKAKHIEDLGFIYTSPGYSNEITHLYYAYDLEYIGTNFDENEDITQVEIPFETLLQMCDEHRIPDAKTVALIYKIRNLNQR